MAVIRSYGSEWTVSIRQLGKHASIVIAELERTGGPMLVTRGGEPVALLAPLCPKATDESDAAARAPAPDSASSRDVGE